MVSLIQNIKMMKKSRRRQSQSPSSSETGASPKSSSSRNIMKSTTTAAATVTSSSTSPSSAVSGSGSSNNKPKSPLSFFGSNKHKRRAVRKNSSNSITEGESLCSQGSSIAPDTAPWRVENIRTGPPTSEEWWKEVQQPSCETTQELSRNYSSDSDVDEENEIKEEGYETIVVQTSSTITAASSSSLMINTTNTANSKEVVFHNCGYETWMKARSEWKKRTVQNLPPRPTPAEYNQLVKGLTKSSSLRTYELPRRMALSDLIDVYTDIWEG